MAEKIFLCKDIITMDNEIKTATAVAVTGDVILKVGNEEDIRTLQMKHTEVIQCICFHISSSKHCVCTL